MFSNSVRRVITGIKDDNTSDILSDEQISAFIPYSLYPSFQIKELFYTETPQSLKTRHLEKPYDINLPHNAMRFLIIRMPTKKEMTDDLINAGKAVPEDWKKYNLHATDSVDYIYVLSGEITCIVGEKEVHLKTGEFITQVGAEHTWVNDSDEPCQLFCVMVGTEQNANKTPVTFEK